MRPAAEVICEELRTAIVRTGWSKTARLSGVRRELLHCHFGRLGRKRGPSLSTLVAVAQALNLRVTIGTADG